MAPQRDPSGSSAATPNVAVGLSTSAIFPSGANRAFEVASEVGYDGVEVMVWSDPVSQDVRKLRELSERHAMPVLSVHAPTTLLTQNVWTGDPWEKLRRSARHAEELGADVVVVHPPFRWQRAYGTRFADGIAELGREHHVTFAVENMYPWRVGAARLQGYEPGWDPQEHAYDHLTLDLSHAATAHQDGLELARAWGGRLRHVHLGDGSGSIKDEHLPPGHGTQPCAQLLAHLRDTGWRGHVVAEVNTRRYASRRLEVLRETLSFARRHLEGAGMDVRDGR